jgi:hypothetical protein
MLSKKAGKKRLLKEILYRCTSCLIKIYEGHVLNENKLLCYGLLIQPFDTAITTY